MKKIIITIILVILAFLLGIQVAVSRAQNERDLKFTRCVEAGGQISECYARSI